MHYFGFKRGELYCEDLKVKDLARRYGTPLYIYSTRTISEHFLKLKEAFKVLRPLICYSVKANSNLSILKLLVNQGAGLDIVSGGELYRARAIKCPPQKIVYASVGKTAAEIKEAVSYGILLFNVESLPELDLINTIAGKLNKRVEVALRFNPDVTLHTHRYITTGRKETKFGLSEAAVRRVFLKPKTYPHLNFTGLHLHIGSQITESTPFVKAIRKALRLIAGLRKAGVSLKHFNIGGGLGIIYDRETPQTAKGFAGKVLPLLKKSSLRIIFEPGRFIVGNAGILATRVLYLKNTPQKRFIIVDAAMNDLVRPSLYGAYHKIIPLKRSTTVKKADVVGPVCESGDFLGKDRYLEAQAGDLLAVMGAGAYGFSMSSNYNSRPRAAEVLVKGKKAFLIRKRETLRDLIRNEIII